MLKEVKDFSDLDCFYTPPKSEVSSPLPSESENPAPPILSQRRKRDRDIELDRNRGRGNDLTLTLLKPLHDDQDVDIGNQLPRLAQVWIARTPYTPDSTVVMKIFQTCFFEEPCYTYDGFEWKTVDFRPEEELVQREELAYRTLSPLQGRGIPHSYGFFEVCLSLALLFFRLECHFLSNSDHSTIWR